MIEGIDRITYGVEDIAACRKFFLDWGLKLVREDANGLDFESLNGCELLVRKADDPSLPPAVEAGLDAARGDLGRDERGRSRGARAACRMSIPTASVSASA